MTRRDWAVVITIALVCAAFAITITAGQWQSYWVQWVVGNVLPPSFWTLLGIGFAHWHLHKKLDAQHEATTQKLDANHEALKRHVTERTAS